MKQHKYPGIRNRILAVGVLISFIMCAGISYAWYARVTREAKSSVLEVMKPYYLTVFDYTGTSVLNLTVGSLYPGEVKQIVFCVSNKNIAPDGSMQMGISDFDYTMELVHTDNLALQYKLYEVEQKDNSADADFTITEGSTDYYWKKKEPFLAGNDVSQVRRQQAGLTDTADIINKGTYYAYDKDGNGNIFHLKPEEEEGYAPDYYLLEIAWDESQTVMFDQYLKETDMIYILVKALQPEPVKK